MNLTTIIITTTTTTTTTKKTITNITTKNSLSVSGHLLTFPAVKIPRGLRSMVSRYPSTISE